MFGNKKLKEENKKLRYQLEQSNEDITILNDLIGNLLEIINEQNPKEEKQDVKTTKAVKTRKKTTK